MGGRPMVYVERVLRTLFVAGERGATVHEIAADIYDDREDGGPLGATNCVHQYIMRLRALVEPHGARIVGARGRNSRYRLVTPRRA